MNIFWNCTIDHATRITHTGTYNSLVEASTLTLCILNFGWHWGQKLFKKINDNITFISILWSMMFTGLCYSNRLAKITNYENWHTKLMQQSLKEKYMTSSMTAIKAFQFFVFVYFYLFFVVLCFFLISYKVGTCPLYGMSGGFGHLFLTSTTTQLGRTSLTSSIKYLVHVCAPDTGNFFL